ERNPGNTDSDSLTESINVVINNSISAPEQLGDLIDKRNKVRGVLAAAVESFLQEAKCLPVRQRMDKL
ncbi:unnamed protein product, partial [Coregonus sp. 'balchen']